MKTVLVLHLFDNVGALRTWTYEWRDILPDRLRLLILEHDSRGYPLEIERDSKDNIRSVVILGNGCLRSDIEYIRVLPFMLEPADTANLVTAIERNGWRRTTVPMTALPASEEYIGADPKTAPLLPAKSTAAA